MSCNIGNSRSKEHVNRNLKRSIRFYRALPPGLEQDKPQETIQSCQLQGTISEHRLNSDMVTVSEGIFQCLKGEESFVLAWPRRLAIEGLVSQTGAESEGR